MILLSIGTDRKLFEKESAVRARMIEFGKLFTQVHIIVFSKKEMAFEPEQISSNVWIYPTSSHNRFMYFLDARKIFKKKMKGNIRPDVITTQDPFETGIAGWLIHRTNKAKLHIQIHTDFLSPYFIKHSLLNRVRVSIARLLLPKADAVRVVSERIRQSLSKIDPHLLERTKVLPIYTNIEKIKNTPITIDLHKNYPQFSSIILMASRLTSEKNITLGIESMRDIVLKHKDAGLVIVGDGPEKKYLQALALRYHLDRNVAFESWQQSLVSYYKTADIFLSTSFYEGYGLTIVEAQASGCPVVTTDVGIAPMLIDEGSNGFICNVKDPSCFSKKIHELIVSPEKRKIMKEKSVQAVDNKISLSKDDYLKLSKEIYA